MRNFLLFISVLVLPLVSTAQFMPATPPVAMQKTHWRVLHNDSVADPYFWMYDYFGKGVDSNLVVENLKAENEYLGKVMSSSASLRENLFKEMKARIKETDQDIPVYKKGYYYYKKTESGKQYFKYCRKKGNLNAPEEVLLDIDQMAKGHPYYKVSSIEVSDNSRLLAFAVDELSRLQYTIYVKDLVTGAILSDRIYGTNGEPCWAADNQTIFYTSNNQVTLLSEKIKRHKIGTNQSKDAIVYDETDKSNYISVYRSKNGRYIFIKSESTLSTEMRFLDASKANENFNIFQSRLKNVLYTVHAINDGFLILTNKDDAFNFKLMTCDPLNTNADSWRELIPHKNDVLLENIDEYARFIVIQQRRNGLEELCVREWYTGNEYLVDFYEPDFSLSPESLPDFNSLSFRFKYSSFLTPTSLMEYNTTNKKRKLLKKQMISGGYDSSLYTTERIMVTARDGESIPLSLVYKKGFRKDGQSPVLLYGYGSYGYSTEVNFSSNRLSLLNRGFCFAIAHIRGGQEMGRLWYENGKLLKKKNSFYDFIDCAEYLVKEKYTSNKHLYAMGRSAGGLLMGAITTMRPDLWNGIIAEVPFVDVVNTMLDETIPLTTNEFDEWGNPKQKVYYDYMKTYNPYENVQAVEYPHLLVTTGLHDSQVQYFEPQKWVAKLRATKMGDHLILLHTNMEYGHGGASGRFDYLKDVALNYSFLLSLEGINR